jgi:nucleoid-associated protein YgaU
VSTAAAAPRPPWTPPRPPLALATELPRTPPPGASIHVVREGDTLWDIARRYRGDSLAWPLVYDANRSRIAVPDLIYPGQRLVVAPQ